MVPCNQHGINPWIETLRTCCGSLPRRFPRLPFTHTELTVCNSVEKNCGTVQLGYSNTATAFNYSIMIIFLSMYVMAACVFILQGTFFQGRPGPFWAPHLHPYFCSALQVLFACDASADRAPIKYRVSSDTSFSHIAQLQPVTSACVPARPACA